MPTAYYCNTSKTDRSNDKAKESKSKGCGGGQVVSVRAFYSDDLCLNPSGVYNFSVKIGVEKNEN